MPYRVPATKESMMKNILKLVVPHGHFGTKVTKEVWDAVHSKGLMASLPFDALARFVWLTLCGWSLIEYDNNEVLFVKELPADSD